VTALPTPRGALYAKAGKLPRADAEPKRGPKGEAARKDQTETNGPPQGKGICYLCTVGVRQDDVVQKTAK